MEFNENRAKRPFYLFIWMGKLIARWYRINRTRQILSRLSDEHLRDIGLSREELPHYGRDGRVK